MSAEPLKLADVLEQFGGATAYQAAAELRRLHAENERLRESLREMTHSLEGEVFLHDDQRSAFVKAIAALK